MEYLFFFLKTQFSFVVSARCCYSYQCHLLAEPNKGVICEMHSIKVHLMVNRMTQYYIYDNCKKKEKQKENENEDDMSK